MLRERYQGWANWETWNVALWFGNDYGLYQAVKEHSKRFTADSAEEFVRELLPDGTPDFHGGSSREIARAYAKVDWQEIADDFNEMRGEEAKEARRPYRRSEEMMVARKRKPTPRKRVGKPRVVSVKKYATNTSSGERMSYEDFVSNPDLPTIFGSPELTTSQAIDKLYEMGWEDDLSDIANITDEDEQLDALVEWADEHGAADNTYNWSWWGPTLHFIGVQAERDPYKPEMYFVRLHRGGDVRGNYGAYHIIYVEESAEQAPWYSWMLTAELKMDDGTEVIIDSEDMEAWHWNVHEDPTGKLGDSVKTDELESAFEWDERLW